MDIERLREFVQFSRTMNFTTAARELHMSQPNLSKHIRDMERDAGVTLVKRGGVSGQTALTVAGARFLDYARRAVAEYDSAIEECRQIEAAEPPVKLQDLRHVINAVSQLRTQLKDAGCATGNFSYVPVTGPVLDALDDGTVDFAFSFQPFADAPGLRGTSWEEEYGAIPLRPEPLRAVVSAESALAGREAISLAELEQARVLRGDSAFFEQVSDAIAAVFASRGCRLSFSAFSDRPLSGGAYPMDAQHVNLCTERFIQYYSDLDAEDFSVVGIEDFQPTIYPFLLYRRDNESPAVQRIVGVLEASRAHD